MFLVTLLDNQDTEMLGEDSQIPRKIIAPLLTEVCFLLLQFIFRSFNHYITKT
jgi:hypothetical protein